MRVFHARASCDRLELVDEGVAGRGVRGGGGRSVTLSGEGDEVGVLTRGVLSPAGIEGGCFEVGGGEECGSRSGGGGEGGTYVRVVAATGGSRWVINSKWIATEGKNDATSTDPLTGTQDTHTHTHTHTHTRARARKKEATPPDPRRRSTYTCADAPTPSACSRYHLLQKRRVAIQRKGIDIRTSTPDKFGKASATQETRSFNYSAAGARAITKLKHASPLTKGPASPALGGSPYLFSPRHTDVGHGCAATCIKEATRASTGVYSPYYRLASAWLAVNAAGERSSLSGSCGSASFEDAHYPL
jgi:hypothetical protein